MLLLGSMCSWWASNKRRRPVGTTGDERADMDRCDPCKFTYADVEEMTLPARFAAFGPRYRTLLLPSSQPAAWPGILRTRPAEGVWSALEYACHVRDVFLVQRDRLYTALVEDTPVCT